MTRDTAITEWVRRLGAGDGQALEAVIPLLYDELRALAGHQLRQERPDHTLSATGLVHEAWLRLSRQRRIAAEDRAQFLSIAGATMRRVLVDWARTKKRAKRGGGQADLPLSAVEEFLTVEEAEELLALDDALARLEVVNERGARVVEHRFFAGLSQEETAEALGISPKTVQRAWVAARAWLRKEVQQDLALDPPLTAP
ncbi:MAG: ECF-type sigma factor [Gemmatimonadota bacterium]